MATWSSNRIVYVPAGARSVERSIPCPIQAATAVRSRAHAWVDPVEFWTMRRRRAEVTLESWDTSLSHRRSTVPGKPFPVVGFVKVWEMDAVSLNVLRYIRHRSSIHTFAPVTTAPVNRRSSRMTEVRFEPKPVKLNSTRVHEVDKGTDVEFQVLVPVSRCRNPWSRPGPLKLVFSHTERRWYWGWCPPCPGS